MAGIYIHIPFCKKKCIYCDFYSIGLSERKKADYLAALEREHARRIVELQGELIETVYIGGGTPSLLLPSEISRLVAMAKPVNGAEVTVEVNPDDVTKEYVSGLVVAGVNRISMGVQSFNDDELLLLRRRHDSQKALDAIAAIKAAGISNISIDLIYGIPGQTPDSWQWSVATAIAQEVPHISAYSLTYEEGTTLTRMRDRKQLQEVSDDDCVSFYNHLVRTLTDAGYEQYEISNFARPGMHSRHNSAYWRFFPYLGLGAAAHSFDGKTRRYNPYDIKAYTEAVVRQGYAFTIEEETDDELYNEWVMTGLRTARGIDSNELKSLFGENRWQHFQRVVEGYVANGYMGKIGSQVRLTQCGVPVSDMIFRDLFIVE